MNRFRGGQNLSPIRQAEAYWTALRAGGAVPKRSQIDPRGLENLLGRAFILERVAPGVARFRLAGHHLSEVFGLELRGMPLTALFVSESRSRAAAALEHLFDAPAVAEFALHSPMRLGLSRLEARMILLPLRDESGAVSRALGVMVADGVPSGSKPRRFELADVDLRPVLNADDPTPCTIATQGEPARGFADRTEAFKPHPNLKLVVSRD